MSMTADLLNAVTSLPPEKAWTRIMDHLWSEFSASFQQAVKYVPVKVGITSMIRIGKSAPGNTFQTEMIPFMRMAS